MSRLHHEDVQFPLGNQKFHDFNLKVKPHHWIGIFHCGSKTQKKLLLCAKDRCYIKWKLGPVKV